MEQQQETPSPESQFVERFQVIEDRLILGSLPVLIFCFVLWAIAAAYPGIATIVNLVITILVVLVACVVVVRLVEVAWQWVSDNSDESPGSVGAGLITFLLIAGIWALINTITHAGEASLPRTFVMAGLLLILALQYRTIIARWRKK